MYYYFLGHPSCSFYCVARTVKNDSLTTGDFLYCSGVQEEGSGSMTVVYYYCISWKNEIWHIFNFLADSNPLTKLIFNARLI